MVKFKDFSKPLSVFQVLFKVNLIFKEFSRQSCIFKYFSSLCEPCFIKVQVWSSIDGKLAFVQSTCDVSMGYGHVIFKICHSAEFNKILEATKPVNLYHDCRVSLQWPHGRGDLDIIKTS